VDPIAACAAEPAGPVGVLGVMRFTLFVTLLMLSDSALGCGKKHARKAEIPEVETEAHESEETGPYKRRTEITICNPLPRYRDELSPPSEPTPSPLSPALSVRRGFDTRMQDSLALVN